MADSKISSLTAYTPAIDTDVLPIVDVTTGTTKKITWANIKASLPLSREISIAAFPGDGYLTGTGVTLATDGGGLHIPVVAMTDNVNNQVWETTFKVPVAASGKAISKIELIYKNLASSALNINCYFEVKHIPYSAGGTITDDATGTTITSASPTTSGRVGIITAPASAFNAISTTLTAGDLIVVYFNRQGNDAADTYGQILECMAMVVTFV